MGETVTPLIIDGMKVACSARFYFSYPNAFQNAEDAAWRIGLLLLHVIIEEWADGKFDDLNAVEDIRFPRHVKTLANACFYTVSQNYPEKSAEYKIALFIHLISRRIVTTIAMPTEAKKLFSINIGLAIGFLRGHFMNIEGVYQHLVALQKSPP